MSYKIAIASGKGGTGKTTVSLLLFQMLQHCFSEAVSLVDCDVEEPNGALFLKEKKTIKKETAYQSIPEIDLERCTFCKKCVSYCEFNAITMVSSVKMAEVNESLCHSCGACFYACNAGALTEKQVPIGSLSCYDTEIGSFYEGRLKVGSVMQTRLIGELQSFSNEEEGVILYDAPPGTSCPVVETIHDVDYVVLVAEPTIFGLHDLKLMVALVKELSLPCGVIINKSDWGNAPVEAYLQEQDIEVIGKIPYNKSFAQGYASGDLLASLPDNIKEGLEDIAEHLKHKRVEQ